jgi:PPOX class probable F420-dependent enzyme
MEPMTRAEALEFLAADTRTGKLATAAPSGAPHVAPVWFVVVGDELVFTTGHDTIKGRHLRANPRAAVSVDVAHFPYSFVVVRGGVRLDEHASDLLEWSTRLAARYVPAGRAEEYGRRNAVDTEMVCHMSIDHIRGERDIAA